jgi:hypothetical protein
MNNTVIRIILSGVLSLILAASPAISGSQRVYLQPEEGLFGFTMLNPYYEAIRPGVLASTWHDTIGDMFIPFEARMAYPYRGR